MIQLPKLNGFILDCSVAMSWCFDDETSEYSEKIFDSLNDIYKAYVPIIWPLEMANVLFCAERKKRLPYLKAVSFIEFIRELPIMYEDRVQTAIGTILELARETNLTVYDASYLELALNLNLPLATLDKDMRKAAEKMGIELLK